MQPGSNLFQLLATNTFGYTGYAERSFEVVAQAPPDETYGLELDFNGQAVLGPVGQVIEALVSGPFGLPRPAGEGAPRSIIPVTLTHAGQGVYQGSGSFGTITMALDAAASEFNAEGPDILVFGVTMPAQSIVDFTVALAETPPLSPTDFIGEFAITEADRPTWDGYGLSVGAVSGVAASGGGSFHPHLIEVIGPPGLAELWRTAQLTPDGLQYKVLRHGQSGRFFLAHEGDTVARAFMLIDTRALDQTFDVEFSTPLALLLDCAMGLRAGVGSNFTFIDGVGAIVSAAWSFQGNYSSLAIATRIAQGDGLLTVEDRRKAAAAGEFALLLASLSLRDNEIVYPLLFSDHGVFGDMSEEQRLAGMFVVETIDALSDWWDTVEEYDACYVAGRIIGGAAIEVVLAVATEGFSLVRKTPTMLRVLDRIEAAPDLPPGLLDDLADARVSLLRIGTLCACNCPGNSAADLACDRVASLYVRLRTHDGLNARQALLRVLADTAGDLNRAKFDPGLSRFVENFAREMAEEATGPGGVVDLAKFTTRDELNTLLDGRRRFADAELDVDVHHLARNDLAKILKPGLTDTQHHQMPAIILRKKAHQMSSNRSGAEFERILHNKLPKRPAGGPQYDRDEVLIKLEAVYLEFGLPEVTPIIREWANTP